MLNEELGGLPDATRGHVGRVPEENSAVVLDFGELVLLVVVVKAFWQWFAPLGYHCIDLFHSKAKVGGLKGNMTLDAGN